jgi:hypothetical protein
VKVGDLIRFRVGSRGIVVEVSKYIGTVRVIDFRGVWWSVPQDQIEIISEAQ